MALRKAGHLDLLDLKGLQSEREMNEELKKMETSRPFLDEDDTFSGKDAQEPGWKDIEDSEKIAENDDVQSEFDDLDEGTERGLGTGTLISAINKLTDKSSGNIFDCIILNLSTIVRNNLSKEKTDDEVFKQTESDVHDLIRCVANYHADMSMLVSEPKLMLFWPNYSYLPAIHQRPQTGNRKRVSDITEKFIQMDNLRQRLRIRGEEQNTQLLLYYAGGKARLPYQSTLNEIGDMFKLTGGKLSPRSSMLNYLIISHNPLDYHFMLKMPRTTLLESFTGKFIKPKALGHKVFGTNFIPFNSVTHLLFGDKVLVRPWALRKSKSVLLNLAKKQSWYVRTPSEIAKFVQDSGQAEARFLTLVKL